MMKRNIVLFFVLLLSGSAQGQDFKKHIVFLASDSLHGRAPGTRDELKAAGYIAVQLDAASLEIFEQRFPFSKKDSSRNVIGRLDLGKDSTILISAHYDHLGYGGNKSKEIVKKGIHPGADDNASGVAMMIELAKWIAVQKNWKYNFVFAAYSAHEAGLYGSGHFAKSKLCDSLKIRAAINFDMVGRLDKLSKTLRVSGSKTDPGFLRTLQSLDKQPLHFRFDDANIPISDLKPFAEKGIPILNFTTGVHDDYHRISDVESKINYRGMEDIYQLLQKILSAYLDK